MFPGALDGGSSPFLARVGATQAYLTSTTPHSYIPFSIFALLHATRITAAYRGVTRKGGYDAQIGNLQAAIVTLVLILGGGTVSNVLLGTVPGWVVSPIPILTYGLVPVLAAKYGAASLLLSLPDLPRETLFCLVDGFSRIMGMTTLGVDTVLTHPNQAVRDSPWAMVLIAFISGGGGGMLVPMFRLFGPDWGFTTTPAFVKDGLPIDVWSAAVIGYVYATLIDAHPLFRIVPAYLFKHLPGFAQFFHLPKSYLTAARHTVLLQPAEAKVFCSLLLASMLFASRVAIPYFKSSRKLSTQTGRKLGAKPSTAVAPVSQKDKKNQ
ncbi:uncharacterized protein JCM15063_004148 [Sporobolomyces koalae]|uniref:uncharacterized protein n=1 Tax=Sporobolomyces koalae TaxID=500713 RepID=UPI00316FD8AE